MKKVEISVIVPIHGTEKYLKRCLLALASQSFAEPYEVILIHDNPCDNSASIIDEFKKMYTEIFKSYEVNFANVSYTRNFGLTKASGEYICFVDSDDFVSRNYLNDFYKKAKEEQAEIIISSYYEFKNNKKKKYILSYFAPHKSISGLKASKLLVNDFRIRGYVWNKLFKASILKNIKFEDVNEYNEDGLFCFKAFLEAKKVAFINVRNYFYQIHDGALTKTWNFKKAILNNLNTVKAEKEVFNKKMNELDSSQKFKINKAFKKILLTYYLFNFKAPKSEKNGLKKKIKNELKKI